MKYSFGTRPWGVKKRNECYIYIIAAHEVLNRPISTTFAKELFIQRGVGTCLQRNALTSSESDPRGTLRKPPLCVSQTRAQSSCQHRSEPVWQWFVYTASDTGLTPRYFEPAVTKACVHYLYNISYSHVILKSVGRRARAYELEEEHLLMSCKKSTC